MPRTHTPAAERAVQRAQAKDIASARVQHPVTHREAAEILRGDNQGDARQPMPSPTAETYAVVDRVLNLPAENLRPLGSLIARVQGMSVLGGGNVHLSLTTSADFLHLVADASILSRPRSLVVHLSEYLPPSIAPQ